MTDREQALADIEQARKELVAVGHPELNEGDPFFNGATERAPDRTTE